MLLKLRYVGVDSWGRETYKNADKNRYYKVIDTMGSCEPSQWFFSAGGNMEGEPDSPIRADIKIKLI